MSRHAQYAIMDTGTGYGCPLVIVDKGPWDEHLTVTNDAEHVVQELITRGLLRPGQRLFSMSSDNTLDELLIEWEAPSGRFAGFRPDVLGESYDHSKP